jgi:hypothetical protein
MSPNTITIGKPALVRMSWSHFDHAWELKEIIFRKNDNVFDIRTVTEQGNLVFCIRSRKNDE